MKIAISEKQLARVIFDVSNINHKNSIKECVIESCKKHGISETWADFVEMQYYIMYDDLHDGMWNWFNKVCPIK